MVDESGASLPAPWVYCWVCDENHEGPECNLYDEWDDGDE